MPGQRAVHWAINEGKLIGQPRMFFANYTYWRPPVAPAQLRAPMVWRRDRAMGGGAMVIDSGFHFLDTVRYFYGEPEQAYAQLRTFKPDAEPARLRAVVRVVGPDGDRVRARVRGGLGRLEAVPAADSDGYWIEAAVEAYVRDARDDVFADADREPAAPEREREIRTPSALQHEDAGITSVIWCTGYGFDFDWVRVPVFDEGGSPVQRRGVTAAPGFYFLGLHWMHTFKSGLFSGVRSDAEYIAEHIDLTTRRSR